ncbi:SDR family NAD(P)-dependent oxidoreductase [Streptomyces sp. J2-1]|uniref:SDR family NAD(P)-dependent oxidoreductase n=1 Tax=Streptomyces corallincola TaxID=2851888 RepID=UPI001C395A79|nr:SDR family NAD(P)-dependent oxidoreductase [Streptomyces corallincola]MBV2355693.1 SDR family NAD(P)-dependent oxidoreductase [Streptomyces corallincola]
MSQVIAVFGAGSGLGAAVARRFGREGFRVALVARRRDRLVTLAKELAEEGVEADVFPADLSQPSEIPALVQAIRDRFGRIDVVEYGPIGGDLRLVPAAELDSARLSDLLPLLLLTPVEVVRAVLPEWVGRGDGAFLLTQGYSAAHPFPQLSGPGPVMAAARNYLFSLNEELAPTGVYAGTLTIASSIARSEMGEAERVRAANEPADGPLFPFVDPDELADRYWDMYVRRDQVESFHPESLTPLVTR